MRQQESDFTSSVNVDAKANSYFEEQAGATAEVEKKISLRALFEGVLAKLGPLFSIDCAALVLYNEEMNHITRAYLSELVSGKISCVETISDPVSLSLITKEISGFDFPVLKSRQDWIDDFGENHCLTNHPIEYHFHCYIPLEHNGRIWGTFELHNHNRELSAEGLTFCCNMADFLAGLLAVMADKNMADPAPAKHHAAENIIALQSASIFEEKTRLLENEIEALKEQLAEFQVFKPEEASEIHNHTHIVGSSPEMQQVYKLLNRISNSETTVLILGETGTGKELIAKSIHDSSGRSQKAMVKVNCAAIPPNLIESELFGHEKGSFTGATERRIGKFEQAHKGTIFLDEIGELPLDLQVKLLRVLQEKEIERVGGKTTISTDVRIISATNRNLLAEVEAGRFRRDLFYRLNVFPVSLPALRDRKTDIALLATFFLKKFAQKSNRTLEGFSKKAISTMMAYSWPGNVRELEHLVERHVVMAQGAIIKEVEIPGNTEQSLSVIAPVKTIFENERDHIFAVLELCNGKISGANGAAKLLGVPATTLNSKIKRLGLAKRHVF
ncbi:sigma-54-dependent transcriptional regulator [Pedobacter rhizosphaerae]|uniref:DNA-binding transcriptional response regulator, NtrC family, contains REC, AAA-type ATPase, and a Fis-type DNA-binding domains n=1 Tax=Pedobacter rhizosphaerae TaxID=390241 RepID=A0A1H9VCM2_9SPHI|nr:sigma-54 dependent transcriptional regulator [Pedobacter rhizosphaerae]SES19506.1 DNA-binding transcriptional response regulator, NtrC family, contains REC, AAA-type ATPase, and a Fis-type DNA-binding domains [Pedobacter rhizosphaerae]